MIQSPHYNDTEIFERLRAGDRALMDALKQLVSHVMVPHPDNFTPPERTPWGGVRILTDIKCDLNIEGLPQVVGESWEISAHPSFPSCFSVVCDGRTLKVSLPALEAVFPELHLPYLVKFLNSGSDRPRGNLSVQVHPPAADSSLKAGENPKTEASVIIDAEPGAGMYLDLKEGVTRVQFEQALEQGLDVSSLLNFVEVKAGDVFFVPSGVIHAIGAGILMLEPQETSETTYRVYDFGRTDAQGKPRQLHVERAMAVTKWNGPRGEAAVAAMRRYPQVVTSHPGTAMVECLLEESVFTLLRITLQKNQDYIGDTTRGIFSYTVLSGVVTVASAGRTEGVFAKGQSFIMPRPIGVYSVVNKGDHPALLIEMSAVQHV